MKRRVSEGYNTHEYVLKGLWILIPAHRFKPCAFVQKKRSMLSFISLNTRGLRDNVKRKAIFLFCKEQKVNCIFLQETHSVKEDSTFWKGQWGDTLFFSHGTSHSAGVMILLNRFPGNIVDHKSDDNGHWVMVIIEINGVKYILLCVYGFNRKVQNKSFFSSLSSMVEGWKTQFTTDKVIIGGDFNIVPDLWLDRMPPKGNCHNFDEIFLDLVTKLGLIDYWRMLNPGAQQYTWFNAANNGQCSRLDYWLLSDNLVNYGCKCEISASPLTDHCLVKLSLSMDRNEEIPNHIWKFNNMLLENVPFCTEVKKIIGEIDSLEMSNSSKWEWFKFQVKQMAIKTSKQLCKIKKSKHEDIIKSINQLSCKPDLSVDEHITLNNLQSQLDTFYLEKAKGAFVRSRAHWIEEGEKNSSYFFNLEKQRQTKKKIQKLTINGCISDNQLDINREVTRFYSNLYNSKFSETRCLFFFEEIEKYKRKINDDFKETMENDLKIEELDRAVTSMAKGKSPGIDGLTIEFYMFFWKEIRILLYEAFKECILSKNLSATMKHGLITLIPKPNKDSLSLDNWRPITLLCNDYKLLAHVYANRLNEGLATIIDESQSAFIKGRNIHNHTRLILDMLDYREFIHTDGLVLFLDFYKAFDTVEHSFLMKALNYLGFGESFCNIVQMFYNNIYSSVILNTGMTPRFEVMRGIRQGCPISPKLFILTT